MPLSIIRNDITKLEVDAIVNAANTSLLMGGGVCGAIFAAAGPDKLQAACDELAPIKTGEAVITPGFALPAKHVIHTAGPVYSDGKHGEEALLRSCYLNSLELAAKHDCESLAFPLISSGIYGYPKDEALAVATDAIGKWLLVNDMDVYLVVFDKSAFMLSTELMGEIKAFVDENYVDELETTYERSAFLQVESKAIEGAKKLKLSESSGMPKPPSSIGAGLAIPVSLEREINQLDEPFAATILRLIDSKGRTDVEVYKRANIDRKLFSKIRNPEYRPSKKTVLALAVALELDLAETDALLECAGFALSRSQMFDVIVEYFITRGRYDVYDINNVLFEYDQQLLGG